MNLLARREHEYPVELERTFPGVEEFFRSIFGSTAPELLRRHDHWGPVHDLQVGDKAVTLQLSCPGHKAEDFDVEITGNLISVRTCCQCEEEHNHARHNYTFKERACMNFEESLHLPVRVESAGAKASYENGVLKVVIPREAKSVPETRAVKVSCGK